MAKRRTTVDLEFVQEPGGPVLYASVDGKRIARRRSGQTWTNIEPGYVVRGGEPGNYDNVVVEYTGTNARPQ
jgi:hypothetical protein